MKCILVWGYVGRDAGLPPCGGSGLKFPTLLFALPALCLPPCGGSGLKLSCISGGDLRCGRLPPCGGSGLKCQRYSNQGSRHMSPSMRREWIEMILSGFKIAIFNSSPSMRREWIEINFPMSISRLMKRLPPCGGSGLK